MIGLVYGYENTPLGPIMRGWLQFSGLVHKIIAHLDDYPLHQDRIIAQTIIAINDHSLSIILDDPASAKYFSSEAIRHIYCETYAIEIDEKLLGIPYTNDYQSTFQRFLHQYDYQYYELVSIPYTNPQYDPAVSQYHVHRNQYFEDSLFIKTKFTDRVCSILGEYGKEKYCDGLRLHMDTHCEINIQAKSNRVIHNRDKTTIFLKSNKITSLIHELMHVVHRYFRTVLAITYDIEFNEGMANFVAFDCLDWIMTGKPSHSRSQDQFTSVSFFVYRHIFQNGNNDMKYNRQLCTQTLRDFVGKDNEESNTQFVDDCMQRFYRYMPLNQHRHLFPKELSYQQGYDTIKKRIINSSNQIECLANFLVGSHH